MKEEIIRKAQDTMLLEEIMRIARENHLELLEEEAKKLADRVSGELSEEELECVSGGRSESDSLRDLIARCLGTKAPSNPFE